MSKPVIVGGVVVVALAVAAVVLGPRFFSDRVRERYAETIERGNRLEAEQRPGEAVLVYLARIESGECTPDQVAELRFRLARSQIDGNDLTGGLGTLQELVEHDVKQLNLDLGPLYLELGDRFARSGNKTLAKNAYMIGRGVSPLRFEEFSRRLERLLPPASAPADGG